MKSLFAVILLVGLMVVNAQARPPKPGPNHVWVVKHVNKKGVVVKGHWKHKSKVKQHQVWVPEHIRPNGKKVKGHWVYR